MKKYSLWFILAIVVLVMSACGSGDDDAGQVEEDNGANDEPETVTVEHELGTTEVEKNPEKVVVFDFGILDSIDTLGIDVTGIPQATMPVYLDKFESDDYENVGSLKEPDFEKIAEIDPDLIVISSRQADLYDQLTEITDNVIYLGIDTSRYMDSFEENMHTLGEIFDKEDQVNDKLGKIEESIDILYEKASDSDKDALIVMANDDKISAFGPESRFGLIHDVFGVKASDDEIDDSTHGKNISFEYVKEVNPDLLYVIDRTAAIGKEPSASLVVENKLVENTEAFKNDDIYYLNSDTWYLSGGGLTSVQMMVDEIAETF